ncbi:MULTISPECIES: TetR/AcrR family transcriptional regulator [unclassified Paenibacillus]|jgi:AcrR family transcriptional regulator|uniref:TetR/AcrR family transcriptional regulator n=1 Tax=unclassified Paenibacillus TaxID=185978 RepID=UPI00096D4740|nr:TetR/AcrR family transcriptional regulator [Paenibacillus sp. FSL H8-0259]OMF23545.1 TetR family transcriptional regulator [Paenibacillus sp. FSL H8-0259]
MNKKTDLRILRTKQSIRMAFIALIQEKGYEAITIQDIADRAMINRNTFYLHYENKPDLLNTYMDELLGELKNAVILCPISMNPYNISVLETIMQTILEHISHNTSFYYAMLIEENRIYPFRAKMEKIIKDKLNEGWNPTAANFSLVLSKDLLFEYLVSSFMGIIIWWVKNDLSIPAGEVASQFSRLVAYGHLKATGIAFEE